MRKLVCNLLGKAGVGGYHGLVARLVLFARHIVEGQHYQGDYAARCGDNEGSGVVAGLHAACTDHIGYHGKQGRGYAQEHEGKSVIGTGMLGTEGIGGKGGENSRRARVAADDEQDGHYVEGAVCKDHQHGGYQRNGGKYPYSAGAADLIGHITCDEAACGACHARKGYGYGGHILSKSAQQAEGLYAGDYHHIGRGQEQQGQGKAPELQMADGLGGSVLPLGKAGSGAFDGGEIFLSGVLYEQTHHYYQQREGECQRTEGSGDAQLLDKQLYQRAEDHCGETEGANGYTRSEAALMGEPLLYAVKRTAVSKANAEARAEAVGDINEPRDGGAKQGCQIQTRAEEHAAYNYNEGGACAVKDETAHQRAENIAEDYCRGHHGNCRAAPAVVVDNGLLEHAPKVDYADAEHGDKAGCNGDDFRFRFHLRITLPFFSLRILRLCR